ncbi:amidohydrolase family protein [Helcobacillus massiliensis]|uniref:amidohydrolase family protein n=1 Tax=Helcobacillus massiliensis TaxID=521392 RepID=UPI0021A5A0E6|nr:amidohydrolase family protein [Helcobacillus massiliensis]MCT1557062.1 amidohydrolase family protein [Helcobacillus massiliensis]MCT2035451.1 amidohydrolase family protein [Helcobacillus massiliensis]MCT2331334.1 amidohydrolase family protein [Helcobacillus massiliensis]
MPLLLLDIVLYSSDDPEASAVLIDDGVIAWTGPASTARALFTGTPAIRADGCLVSPSFVDALPVGRTIAGRSGASAEGHEDPSVPAAGDGYAAPRAALGITDVGPAASGRGMQDGVRIIVPMIDIAVDYLAEASGGTAIAFGSGGEDGSPWRWVRAASIDADPDTRISERAAFLAATRGGRRLLGQHHPGSLNPGAPADLVVWEPWDLTVRGNDERIQTWSTDPRSRTPMLPDLTDGEPRALLTMKDGEVVFDAGELDAPQALEPGE